MAEILIAVVPWLALLAFLLLGRYPGHEAVLRFSDRLAGRHRRSRSSAQPPLRSAPRARVARGGLLLGLALSGRAPPSWSR
jgi:hypothetical protein